MNLRSQSLIFTLICAVLSLTYLPAADIAQANDSWDALLSKKTWDDNGYGISLRPPADSQTVRMPSDGSMVHFEMGQHFNLSVNVIRSSEPIELEEALRQGLRDASFTFTASVRIDDESPVIEIDGREARRFFLLLGERGEGRRIVGYVLLKLDPYHIIVLKMDCLASEYEYSLRRLDAVCSSMRIRSSREMTDERAALIEAGKVWMQTLRAQDLDIMPEVQWYRQISNKQDIGYFRVQTHVTEELDVRGVQAGFQYHFEDGNVSLDRLGQYFLGDDLRTEVWSVRSTRRVQRGIRESEQSRESSAETGLRTNRRLTVNRETPLPLLVRHDDAPVNKGEVRELNWQVPENGYASQIIIKLLPWLLLPREQTDMAFYAYDTHSSGLTLHTVRVREQNDKELVVQIRAAPNQPEAAVTMSADGKLKRIILPNGDTILPTTPVELKSLWTRRR